ncbi:MAG: aminotransferase class V-fold PLP-dependent enzyme [Okeania sp. SIO2F4]|uniref:aminotransferase class V-fold PLP-dependent enzyme n=1 Tax=Okeania sp. SIO2F4 TaxID=2607790 RepID=UPI001429E31A|nr:aminotransferase class V-fold PLP-dependent enzyme [Okeania sp. SIO2F4]NES06696.1 aminotransferase class V-fold PLP-dependent enzyme [Okeania sp. SIO2F4]
MFQYEHTNKWPLYWSLDPNVTFLNHGSFGACPLQVLTAQAQLREKLEREPVHFFIREFETLLNEARGKLAEFVGAKPEELAFVPNATTGVNAVLRSLNFSSTDELLTTDQEYNACRNALNFVSDRTGAKVIVASLPFPIESPQQIVEAVIKHISPRTRLALLDHVSSSTAFVFPIKKLVKELAKRGVDTLVDGAHAVGMLPLNLEEIGAAYYTGNCHKWLCAPKGAGFLYVRKDKQENIHPLTISHGANSTRIDKSRFQLEFDWVGTDDPTAYLCVPEAIKFMGSLLPGGWLELMEKNKSMVLVARHLLQEKLGIKIDCCPDEMIGSMAVVKLPDERGDKVYSGLIPPLQNDLWEKFRIEVPIVCWPNKRKRLLRISAQIYNSFSQYEYLAEALVKLL